MCGYRLPFDGRFRIGGCGLGHGCGSCRGCTRGLPAIFSFLPSLGRGSLDRLPNAANRAHDSKQADNDEPEQTESKECYQIGIKFRHFCSLALSIASIIYAVVSARNRRLVRRRCHADHIVARAQARVRIFLYAGGGGGAADAL
jgi:hypothetical protein